MTAEPGPSEQLSAGIDVKIFDPTHPVDSFVDFEKSILRRTAGSLDIFYATLANDL